MSLILENSRYAGDPNAASGNETRGGRSFQAPNAASTFAAALDIILEIGSKALVPEEERVLLSWREALIAIEDVKMLRLTCKAVRSVIDFHVQTLCTYGKKESLGSLSPWPWANLTSMDLWRRLSEYNTDEEDTEYLVTLPLKNLEELKVCCQNAAPLVQHNWPMLTKLALNLWPEEKNSEPASLEFAKFPHLKSLEVGVGDLKIGCDAVQFFRPLVNSSSQLTHLHLRSFSSPLTE